MAKNIPDSTMPDKITGSTHFAAEAQAVKEWINEPSQSLGAYSGGTITIDGSGRYLRYTMSGNLVISFATSGHLENNAVLLPITSDGSTLTFTANANYDIYFDDSLTNGGALASGEYLFAFMFIDGAIEIGYKTSTKITSTSDVTPPTVTSVTVENADPDALVVVFSEVVTITDTTGLSLDGSWSGVSITGVSGSGTNTLTFALDTPVANGESGNFVYGVTNNIIDGASNALVAGSTAVTNNVASASIIVMQDDFAGVTIDTAKWGVTNPDSANLLISQNNNLRFNILDNSVTIPASNNYINTSGLHEITTGALQIDIQEFFAGTPETTPLIGFYVDANNRAAIIKQSGTTNARCLIYQAGLVVYDTGDSGISILSNTFKITVNASNEWQFWYLPAPDTWTQIGTTQTYNLGVSKYALIGASIAAGLDAINDYWSFDNFYLSNDNYPTSVPI